MSEKDIQAYGLVLEDLRRRKKALEVLISKLESFVDAAGSDRDLDTQTVGVDGVDLIRRLGASSSHSDAPRSVSPGKFERWTLSSAIMWLLDSSDGGCSNAEILTRLAEGGFNFRSKNRAVAVAQCLKRLSDKGTVRRMARGKWANPVDGGSAGAIADSTELAMQ